jgi:hypothetical protein
MRVRREIRIESERKTMNENKEEWAKEKSAKK